MSICKYIGYVKFDKEIEMLFLLLLLKFIVFSFLGLIIFLVVILDNYE